jgi:hypothetical protein
MNVFWMRGTGCSECVVKLFTKKLRVIDEKIATLVAEPGQWKDGFVGLRGKKIVVVHIFMHRRQTILIQGVRNTCYSVSQWKASLFEHTVEKWLSSSTTS